MGYTLLKFLEKENYLMNLKEKLKDLFIDTQIRIIKFSLVDETPLR